MKGELFVCDYQGYEFGAHYPDSVCIDGYLWDADSGDASDDGWVYTNGGELPCPQCNRAAWLDRVGDQCREDAAIAGYDFKWPFNSPMLMKDAPRLWWWQITGWLEGVWQRLAEKRL